MSSPRSEKSLTGEFCPICLVVNCNQPPRSAPWNYMTIRAMRHLVAQAEVTEYNSDSVPQFTAFDERLLMRTSSSVEP